MLVYDLVFNIQDDGLEWLKVVIT